MEPTMIEIEKFNNPKKMETKPLRFVDAPGTPDESAIKLLEALQRSYENGRIYGAKDLGLKILTAYNDSMQQMKSYEIIDLIVKLVNEPK